MLRPLVIVLMQVPFLGNSATVSGAGTGATPMVICGSEGAQTIWLGAKGDPAEAPADCSDCLIRKSVEAAFMRDMAAVLPLVIHPAALQPLPPRIPSLAADHPLPMPRGPPLVARVVGPEAATPQAIPDGIPT